MWLQVPVLMEPRVQTPALRSIKCVVQSVPGILMGLCLILGHLCPSEDRYSHFPSSRSHSLWIACSRRLMWIKPCTGLLSRGIHSCCACSRCCRPLSFHSSVDGCLGFHSLACVNSAAVSICVPISVWAYFELSWVHTPGIGQLGHTW